MHLPHNRSVRLKPVGWNVLGFCFYFWDIVLFGSVSIKVGNLLISDSFGSFLWRWMKDQLVKPLMADVNTLLLFPQHLAMCVCCQCMRIPLQLEIEKQHQCICWGLRPTAWFLRAKHFWNQGTFTAYLLSQCGPSTTSSKRKDTLSSSYGALELSTLSFRTEHGKI